MEYVLETNNIEKRYGHFKALTNLNMHIPKGAIYGLIGKNGAGKTTLIRLLCGLQKATSGKYTIFGISNDSKKIINVRKRIGAIIETPSICLDMTAEDNLKEQYKIIGLPSFNNLQELLILDEPINGLDPEGIIEIRELILKLNIEKGITFLISSHYLDELSKIATCFGIIDKGKIIKEITKEELEQNFKKRTQINVNNIKECVKYLEEKNLNYKVITNNIIDIYEKINVSELVVALSNRDCIVNNFQEKEESLENYYLNLIGGASDD